MKLNKGTIKISTIITAIFLIIVLVILFNIYKQNYYNDFEKAVIANADTKMVRDSKIKFSDDDSYKIQNNEYNDALFYKEIEVEPNTPYKISCMVKTEDVQGENVQSDCGAMIWIMDSYEHSVPVTGTQEWQEIELIFDSKNRETVKIAFRLGGNESKCIGTAWFSDFKLEKGIRHTDTEWNVGCFILKNIDVNIDGKQMQLQTTARDIQNANKNMERYKESIAELSNNQMTVKYDMYEIEEPLTKISYDEEHGYYMAPEDAKDLIYDKVLEEEYDYIFIVARMENEAGDISIPINGNWVGLGAMDMYGIGYSIVRINKNGNISVYEYNLYNNFPEEAYVHEFLHTLERILQESDYDVPQLHDNKIYGYEEDYTYGLKEWYKDYMTREILNKDTGEYVGLYSDVYSMKPYHESDFNYAIEVEFNKEPQNIIEEIKAIFRTLKKAYTG